MEGHRVWHLQLLEWVGRGVEVASREVEIDRRVREVGVTEEQLNGPQIRARLEQVRGVGVS